MTSAWKSQDRPEITLTDGAVIHDLAKYLEGFVKDANLTTIKYALYRDAKVETNARIP